MTNFPAILVEPIPNIPDITPKTDLSHTLIAATDHADLTVKDGNVFIISQKIVSKAENQYVELDTILPSKRALELSQKTSKDPRLVELILSESNEVIRYKKGVIVVEHRLGYVMANAGIDSSNLGLFEDNRERVLLLPENPDATCADLQKKFEHHYHCNLGVIVSDSVGRAWRKGSIGIALGAAGLPALWNRIGEPDLYGRALQVTEIGLADQLACAASLIMGEGAEGFPVVKLGGFKWPQSNSTGQHLLRTKDEDLFR